MVRHSMAFGNSTEHGLMFVAYSNRTSKFDILLQRMIGTGGQSHGSLMDYTTCIASKRGNLIDMDIN